MANKANFKLAVANTPRENGYCELYAELLLAGRSGLYPTAFAAYQAVPQKRGGTPPDDGNYYLIYFDGWYNLGDGLKRYGDIAVYRNGRVWSGSSVNFRAQSQSVSFAYYKSWIGTAYLCWSEYLGTIKVATIGGNTVAKTIYIPTKADVDKAWKELYGTKPSQRNYDVYTKKDISWMWHDFAYELKKQLDAEKKNKTISKPIVVDYINKNLK